MSFLQQQLKRDLPPLPLAALLALGLHLIGFLLLVNGLLQGGQRSKPQQPAPLQLSLQGKITQNDIGLAAEVIPNSIAKAVEVPRESEPLPPISAVATPIMPVETETETETAASAVYWPRSQLSTFPQLQTAITLAYPEDFAPQQSHYETILSVYINEYGQVDRVEIEDRDFPEPLAQSAMKAFQSASYQPGARENLAVKSRIRIAISFDAVSNSNGDSLD